MSDLKPCPFCGGIANLELIAAYEVADEEHPDTWVVTCSRCGSSGPFTSELDAAKQWNRRAAMSEGGEQA